MEHSMEKLGLMLQCYIASTLHGLLVEQGESDTLLGKKGGHS